jgi:hypothetical protein
VPPQDARILRALLAVEEVRAARVERPAAVPGLQVGGCSNDWLALNGPLTALLPAHPPTHPASQPANH